MLLDLRVKNLALIREAELELAEGLHVITGETGAGKSLLLGSLNLALGGKASSDLIGRDSDQALSELVFSIEDEELLGKLSDMDVPVDEEGLLIFKRRLMGGRSSCRINEETYPASRLKEVAELLIDIHGQHEHQSLLKKANHKGILDEYAGSELSAVLANLEKCYQKYRDCQNSLTGESIDEREKEREIALITHEIDEIDRAGLSEGEDDELEARYRLMQNARRIMESLSLTASLTGAQSGSRLDANASDAVSRAYRELSSVSEYDEALKALESTLSDIDSLVSDFNRELSDYMSSLQFDQGEYIQIEERLNLINQLKSRYGNSISDILAYRDGQAVKLEKYQDYDAYIEKLRKELENSEAELIELCRRASDIRVCAAKELSQVLEKALLELNFNHAHFEVRIEKLDRYTRDGFDEVEFLISMNPGEAVRPLADVASGGELSRIMLALRTAGAAKDGIGTLIFDEIDSGISGRTAAMVARKLSDLARTRQVICITHLPQIAAFADHHFLIEKQSTDNETTTVVKKLSTEESLMELTRLLGDTSSAYETARELKEDAFNYKSDTV